MLSSRLRLLQKGMAAQAESENRQGILANLLPY